MNEEQIRQIIRDELKSLILLDKYTFQKNIQIFDGRNIQLGRTNGTKIGTAIDQKLGFYNKAPIIQQATITTPTGGGAAGVDSSARGSIVEIKNFLTLIGLTQ